MANYTGTPGNDTIDGLTTAKGLNIDAGAGDDTVTLASHQIFISGPGNDVVKGNGESDYALWYASGPATVDLVQGYALDGFGYRDVISGINTVHGSRYGATVLGTKVDERFFVFGGQNNLSLGAGNDTALYWEQSSASYSVQYKVDHFEVTRLDTGVVDVLRDVEFLEFTALGTPIQRIDLSDYIPSAFTLKKGTAVNNADAKGNPRWVITDLNHDAYKDLAIRFDPDSAFASGIIAHSPVRFFYGAADGQYTPAPLADSDNLAPTLVNRIVSSDFNGDGLGDIVIAASGQDPYADGKPLGPWPGEVSYVLMSGPAGYKNTPIANVPSIFAHHASLGDINGDSAMDAYIGTIWEGAASASYFLMSDKKGGFVVDRSGLPDSVKDARAVQLKDQSTPDRVVYDRSVFTSSVLFDANNDGAVDLGLLPMGGTQRGLVFLNDGAGHFSDSRKLLLPIGPYGVGYTAALPNNVYETAGSNYLDTKALDFNGDGRLDLVSVVNKDYRVGDRYEYYKGTAVQLMINTPAGFVDESASRVNFVHNPNANYTHYDTIETTDINADGFTDIVLYRGLNSSDGADNTRILLNDGLGHFTDSPYPLGIPKGLLIAVDAAKGDYAVVADAGNLYQAGVTSYQYRVDSVHFDWSLGLDFLSSKTSVSTDQTADLPGRWLKGSNLANKLTLSSGSEHVWGYGGNDQITGLGGDDVLDGGEGIDTAMYRGERNDYLVRQTATGSLEVLDRRASGTDSTKSDGRDQLTGIERLAFSNLHTALDLQGKAGWVAKTLGAVFGPAAVQNKDYAGIGLYYTDSRDYDQASLMQLAITARLGASPSPEQVVDLLYTNVVGQAPDAATRKSFTDLLDKGTHTVASLGILAAETELNKANIKLMGLAQTGLDYLAVPG